MNIQELDEQKKGWDKANPSHVEQKQILSEFYCENPAHLSYKELKAAKLKEDRLKCGLTEQGIDIKDASKDPTLTYKVEPDAKTKGELEQKRRNENFEEFRKTEAKQGKYKDGMQRLRE